ncbi:LysR family transporter transcriptional regulator [Legionella gratiana]|uniref:Transcriptional regulator n=1 Tax=Legionella gratiana TaxID=45066 RepID=A0A378J2L3_9GAMM|nr:LysR family transcriptional regulator [Legionella gratiana]KTD14507.1 LysR family transporter transcriptional regulator [Legionella gratiana]STX41984.1 transcriptional regulator [Legionella gratiana]
MINNQLNLNDLAIFALVVKNQSFTQAALEAGMSKAWVSQKMSQLENTLGIKLLKRTTRALSLTMGGKILFEHCQIMLNEVTNAENHLREYAKAPSGKLVITCPEITGLELLPALLSEFNSLYPQIRTRLMITDQLMDLTQHGIDFAFRTGKLADSTLVSRYIGKVPRCLVASPAYISSHAPIREPEDLKDHALLKHSSLSDWPLRSGEKTFKIRLKNAVIESSSLIFLHKMACLDRGIAFLPYYLCSDTLKNNVLSKVLPEWSNTDNQYYMIYHKDKSVLYINQLFKEFILSSDLKNRISR